MNQPHTLTLDDVEFDKNTGAIEKYTSDYKNIVIPDDFDGVAVVSIGDVAFLDNALTSIIISDSVTSIGNDAFSFNALTNVIIPDSVISIGDSAFYENALTSVIIPNSVMTIGKEAFRNNSLTNVIIPDSVMTIGKEAFRNKILTNVVIPDSEITIGDLTSVITYNDIDDFCCEINVDCIDSLESLNFIADTLVLYSQRVDEIISKYKTSVEHYLVLCVNVLIRNEEKVHIESVFEKFHGHSTLELKLLEFTKNLIQWSRLNDIPILQDLETSLTEQAAYSLSIYDEIYICLYFDALLLDDLDHEVFQSEHIDNLISKYGICENTLFLIALRLGEANGQHGQEQADYYQNKIFNVLIKNPEMKHFFLNAAVKSIYDCWGDDVDNFEHFLEYADTLIDGDNESWLVAALLQLSNNHQLGT